MLVVSSFIILSDCVGTLSQVYATPNIKLLILYIQSGPHMKTALYWRSMAGLLCQSFGIKTGLYTCLPYLPLHSSCQSVPSSRAVPGLLAGMMGAIEPLSHYLSCLC